MKHFMPPLTEEVMDRRIKDTEQSLSTRYMQLILANKHLRNDVRDLIEKALTIHTLNTL